MSSGQISSFRRSLRGDEFVQGPRPTANSFNVNDHISVQIWYIGITKGMVDFEFGESRYVREYAFTGHETPITLTLTLSVYAYMTYSQHLCVQGYGDDYDRLRLASFLEAQIGSTILP
jgi:hypothetical protein